MKNIIILTGSELRHTFFRKFLALSQDIHVIQSYCEGMEKSLLAFVEKDPETNDIRLRHLAAREQAEQDFFSLFDETSQDHSNPIRLPKGNINSSETVQAIIEAQPDLLIAYGCSIIREPLLSAFEGRFLNVHLGLSPYYRGGGTNYWPLVNGEPEYVGATFMHIDAGIDTGDIVHQIRARYAWGDTPSQIGNRLIVDMSRVYQRVIVNFEHLVKLDQPLSPSDEKYYRKKDYTEQSVEILYDNFKNGLVQKYLNEAEDRCAKVPILANPALQVPAR